MTNERKSNLYTVNEVAALLKTSKEYVHKLRLSGKLRFLKFKGYKIREETLEKFLEEFEGYDITDPHNIKRLLKEDANADF